MSTENSYSTSDLYLTAYLKIKGHKFKVEKQSKKSTFIFPSSPDLLSHVDEYLTEMGSCEPLAFTNAIKNLKNLLFNR
tara:strand:- start:1188 stop:1421 length:234 start_codon:yes stop_codon:yes gene_type:complete